MKNISGGKKIKTVQDLSDKLNNTEKDLNECRRIMNSSFNKIKDILSKDMLISDISNQPFYFNYNSFDSNIEQKFFVIFEKFVEFFMIKENQLKNMKEQNEILNHNIHLNDEKNELFELNGNDNCSSINKLLTNVAYKSMAKNKKGFLFKNLSTNTKKAFDGYNKQIPEILEKHDENDINVININKNEKEDVININLLNDNSQNNNDNILNLYERKNKEN